MTTDLGPVLESLRAAVTTFAGFTGADLAPAGSAVRPRSLGSAAASKLLHALRPRALMPWDEAIADHLHGARDAAAYAAHQRVGRAWAAALLAGAGVGEETLAGLPGRPGRTLAKMLDDYCYLRFTRLESG
jgi:hypothetical protein